ncbi:hypothetical protein P1P75_31540 [Streptomyces sp. ID05-39B]|uniref:hypothetical protein n=1 Tax=Streptomyces sp. ID05-39B TaxID=3028664 RepID=UPI0029ABF345|nr:hypothetical protein [Streptomyces sp. ID05-39B]MDX3530818.1 hypothetical protein [Streptomyces sp. ID05-39B]
MGRGAAAGTTGHYLPGLQTEATGTTGHYLPGLQTEATGTTGYQLGATYDPLGAPTQLLIGTDGTSSAKKGYLNHVYEDGTRRLKQSYVTTDAHSYKHGLQGAATDTSGTRNCR